MLRIALFLLTNLAIVIVASITLSLLGFEGHLHECGFKPQAFSLLFCFWYGRERISLLLSKKWQRWVRVHKLLNSHETQTKSG